MRKKKLRRLVTPGSRHIRKCCATATIFFRGAPRHHENTTSIHCPLHCRFRRFPIDPQPGCELAGAVAHPLQVIIHDAARNKIAFTGSIPAFARYWGY
jgi:hypothetical protein